MNIFITPFFLVGIPYIIKILMGMDDKYFGFTQGAISLSMIFSAVAIGLISSRLRINNLYLWFVVTGVLFIPMAVSIYPAILNQEGKGFIQYVVFSLCTMMIMFVITIINIFIMTMLQQQTPNILLGKVVAILTAVSTCAVPIGQIIFGSLIDRFAINIYILVLSVAIITIGVAVVTKKILQEKTLETGEMMLGGSP